VLITFGFDQGKADRDVTLKCGPALRAEARIVSVGMSTTGTEHRPVRLRSIVEWRVGFGVERRPSIRP